MKNVGWEGPAFCTAWYVMSAYVMRKISPSFGKLVALEQKLEGEYRACHSDLLAHSEEIAFYNGNDWERNKINEKFK